MSYSTRHKYKLQTQLLVLSLLLSNILSAQTSKTSLHIPLSISEYKTEQDTLNCPTEFNGLVAKDVLPKAVFHSDTTEIPKTPNVLKTNSGAMIEPKSEEIELSQTDIQIVENTVKTTFYQDSTCIDLTFDSVSIVQITDKYVEIEFSITNKGSKAAPIFGEKRSNTDNVSVHFYYSGTPRLTRGAILADGIYLTEGLKETKGMLAPNAVYKNKFKLSLEKKNRFYGVIILQLDVFDVLRHECDETNNIFAIVPKWY